MLTHVHVHGVHTVIAGGLDIPMDKKGKFPLMGGDYQAVNEPRLYFAGAIAHALDHRQSSGGFIHGFRYTARALVLICPRAVIVGCY